MLRGKVFPTDDIAITGYWIIGDYRLSSFDGNRITNVVIYLTFESDLFVGVYYDNV